MEELKSAQDVILHLDSELKVAQYKVQKAESDVIKSKMEQVENLDVNLQFKLQEKRKLVEKLEHDLFETQ